MSVKSIAHKLSTVLISLSLVSAGFQGMAETPTATLETAAPPQQALPVDLTVELKATRPWKIALVVKDENLSSIDKMSEYWRLAWQGAQQAEKDFGVTMELYLLPKPCAPQPACVEPQIRLVADLVARGETDGLVLAPFDSNRLVPVVEKAIRAGIPTVTMDNALNSDKLVTFVEFDNFAAGRVLGEWVVKQLGGKGKALILEGPPDEHNAVARRNGFLAGLQSGDIDVLAMQKTDWNVTIAKQTVTKWLQEFSDIQAILAANDNMALGVSEVVTEAQRQGILITGFDATQRALRAIQAGQLAATVAQAPDKQARLAIQVLVRHLETGETFPPRIVLPEIPLVTKENVKDYLSEK